MDLSWFSETSFRLFGRTITLVDVGEFTIAVLLGVVLSIVFQSDRFRHLLSRGGLEKRFVALVTTIFSLVILVAAVLTGIELAGIPINWNGHIPGLPFSGMSLLRLILLLVFVFWLSSQAKHFLFSRFLGRSGMDRALQYAVAQVAGYIVLIVGVFIVIQNTGLDLSTLTVFAGALGVGLGFGLQNIANNFISGLVILAERPVKIGDRVEVGELAGAVTQIRARSTTIVTNDNISIIVPNSRFIQEPVTNWSHGDPKVRFRIPVGVAYGTDVELLCRTLVAVAQAHPAALARPTPEVFFEGFGDSALKFELVVWSDEMSFKPRRFRSDLNFGIEKALREAGIVIPFPQRDLHFISDRTGRTNSRGADG